MKPIVSLVILLVVACCRAEPASAAGRDTADKLNDKGNKLEEQGQYETALGYFNQALRINPHHLWAYHGKGECLMHLGREREAESAFRAAMQANPHNKWAPWRLGSALSGQGKFEQAIKAYDKALELDRPGVQILIERANAYAGLHRFNESVADCQAVLKINPNNHSARRALANDYLEMNQPQKAIEQYTYMVDHFPTRDGFWNRLRAAAYEKSKQYQKAIDDYSVALKAQKGQDSALRERARDYELLGKYDQAIADYTSIIAIASEETAADAYRARADDYVKTKRYAQAIADYTKSMQLDPDEEHLCYVGRARAYEGMGNHKAAEQDRQRAQRAEDAIR